MNICTIAPGFNRHGGVPYVARNVVDQLARRGANCWVVTDQQSSEDVDGLSADLPIYTRERGESRFPLNIVNYARKIRPLVERLDREHDLDLIHTHGNYVLATILTDAVSDIDATTVTTIHDTHLPEIDAFTEYPSFEGKWKYCAGIYIDYRIQRFSARRVDKVHTVGSRVVSELSNRGVDPNDIGLVHNGIDLDEFDSATVRSDIREEYDLGDRELIISVGSVRPRKGIHTLVEAADILREHRPDARIAHIGGYGRTGYIDYVEERIDALGLEETVSLIGSVPRAELLGWFDACDVLVSPSYSEGNPINVLEAAASECSIVTTEVWDAREILGNDGVFVTPGSPSSLASGIRRGLDADVGRALRERVEANYTWDDVGDDHYALFESWANER
jgi:glycosyltransferase involved in cell wall biosynthesis